MFLGLFFYFFSGFNSLAEFCIAKLSTDPLKTLENVTYLHSSTFGPSQVHSHYTHAKSPSLLTSFNNKLIGVFSWIKYLNFHFNISVGTFYWTFLLKHSFEYFHRSFFFNILFDLSLMRSHWSIHVNIPSKIFLIKEYSKIFL